MFPPRLLERVGDGRSEDRLSFSVSSQAVLDQLIEALCRFASKVVFGHGAPHELAVFLERENDHTLLLIHFRF